MAFSAVVVGASGFAGGELLRLLEAHPAIDVVAAGAGRQAGRPIREVFPALTDSAPTCFCSTDDALSHPADLLFCSLPHGQSSKLLPRSRTRAIVDLAGDFRLRDPDVYRQWFGEHHPDPASLEGWVYGLTEFHREEISAGRGPDRGGAVRVANPGCYAAASILAVRPLLEARLIDPSDIHLSAMSGVSGAGRAQGEGFDFVSANENVRAYKPTGHSHIGEIQQELSSGAGATCAVSFVPHLVPMNRGILVTAVSRTNQECTSEDLTGALNRRYAEEPFVRVLRPPVLPETKRLSGTNFAEVAATVDPHTGKALIFAAIDNLGKGAAGQAVQNANLMLGLEETTGLTSAGLV